MQVKLEELLEKRTFWTAFISEIDAYMLANDVTTMSLDKIDFSESEKAFDDIVGIATNKHAYLDIMNDTTSSIYKVQFIYMKSKTHSRRKILSVINDSVKFIIMKYINRDEYILNGQTCVLSDFVKSSQTSYINDDFTSKYVIDLVYTKVLSELCIVKSKKESTLLLGIKMYILYAVIAILKSLSDSTEDYYQDWINSFEV